MTIRSIFTHVSLLAGLAVALLLVPAPGANAACSDPADFQVDWGECDLSGAVLPGAVLPEANLSGANLSGADLWVANLSGADLTGANLTGANLDGADLTDATLDEADLSNATLGGTTWVDGRVCAPGSVGTCD